MPGWYNREKLRNMTPQERIARIFSTLQKKYPQAKTALIHENPFELLIATILSAQCTDKQVNRVTPKLFEKYKTPFDLSTSRLPDLEHIIHSTGFYKNKAKNITACSQKLVTDFRGKVPSTMKELTTLPGVGRKTANVVLFCAFGKNEGICVDTHVGRLSQRLGFSKTRNPIKVEQDLMKIVPKKNWGQITNLLIQHGRVTCHARKPKCPECEIRSLCLFKQKSF